MVQQLIRRATNDFRRVEFALQLYQLMLCMVRPGPHNSQQLLDTVLAIQLNPIQLVGRGFASRHDLQYSVQSTRRAFTGSANTECRCSLHDCGLAGVQDLCTSGADVQLHVKGRHYPAFGCCSC